MSDPAAAISANPNWGGSTAYSAIEPPRFGERWKLGNLAGEGFELALATAPIPVELLSAGERARYDELPPGSRRPQWLTARAALRSVLAGLGEPPDTAGITFPNACYSLSHSPELAVAVGVPAGRAHGVGVDVEPRRPVSLETGRFFLTTSERAWLDTVALPRRADELLRLWTVKEAAFKANLGNAGTTLIQYRIDDPALAGGTASCGEGSFTCSYATAVGRFGYLTVASATSRG